MPPKKQRTPELRERLLDEAILLLGEEGVAAVTTRRVATLAGASAPAIYELFGGKAGLVRGVFYEGFRRLSSSMDELPSPTGDVAEVVAAVKAFRNFTRQNPRLFEVMYSRPFEEFAPTSDEQTLGDGARRAIVERLQSCIDVGNLTGDAVDIAHAVLGLSIGLAMQDTAGWLGSTDEVRDRRWSDAVRALLAGYA